MRWQAVAYRKVLLLVAVAAMLGGWSVRRADAQVLAGVAIDAKGVVHRQVFTDPTGQGNRQRAAAALAALSHDVAKFSRLRKISLTRLEQAIRAAQGAPTDEMRYLAGLLRVRYVFFYPDSRDIVIAGPAEGWMDDISGRIVGLTTGRPVVQLQDLVVALRAFPPGKNGVAMIGCSIDPTREGLAGMQAFLKSTGSNFMAGQEQMVAQYVTQNLPAALGMQVVSVIGVSPKTHFAQVLVEADYRMKLIGIGLERPPVKMVAFVDKVSPAQVSRNALFRWYFVPDYKCVRVTQDKQAMELVGDGVKLVGEDEVVNAGGQRKQAGRANMASTAFATSFTQKYSALAETVAGLRRAAEPHRPGRLGGLHPGPGLLRQGRLGPGLAGQREGAGGRDLQRAAAGRGDRGGDHERQPLDDAHRRRRTHRGPRGPEAGELAPGRKGQTRSGPQRREPARRTLVVGLT